MSKINEVKRAYKDQGHCMVVGCSRPISAGDRYFWVQANRFSPKVVHCWDHPEFRRSEIDSTKLATALAAIEEAEDALQNFGLDYESAEQVLDEIRSIMETAADGVEECRDEYQEGLDNMPEGLQEGDVGQQIQEKIDELDSYAQTLRDLPDNIDDFDDLPDVELGEWIESVISQAEEALADFSL